MITLDPSIPLPSVPMIEQSVLSVLLNHPEKLHECHSLSAEHFYDPGHSAAFTLISSMIRERDQKQGFDLSGFITSLANSGQIDKLGGASKVYGLFGAEPTAAHFVQHLGQLNEFLARRLAIQAAIQLSEAAFGDSDPQAMLDAASGPVTAIFEAITESSPPKSTKALLKASLDRYLDRMRGKVSARGIETGIEEIDSTLFGLFPGRVFCIGAFPSGGKSVIGSQILVNVALNGVPCSYHPLEMSEDDLIDRAIIQASRVPAGAWTDPTGYAQLHEKEHPTKLLKDHMNAGVQKLIDSLFFIRKPANKKLMTVISSVRKIHREHGVKVVAIDFIQQIRVPESRGNKEQAMEEISHSIQELAEELQIAIILLSQLNSEGDTKHGRVIEEDADAFLQIVQDMDKKSDTFRQHRHILIIKDRHYGNSGRKLPLIFDKDKIKFVHGENQEPTKKGNKANF